MSSSRTLGCAIRHQQPIGLATNIVYETDAIAFDEAKRFIEPRGCEDQGFIQPF
jgi:hypothetical protein